MSYYECKTFIKVNSLVEVNNELTKSVTIIHLPQVVGITISPFTGKSALYLANGDKLIVTEKSAISVQNEFIDMRDDVLDCTE